MIDYFTSKLIGLTINNVIMISYEKPLRKVMIIIRELLYTSVIHVAYMPAIHYV